MVGEHKFSIVISEQTSTRVGSNVGLDTAVLISTTARGQLKPPTVTHANDSQYKSDSPRCVRMTS